MSKTKAQLEHELSTTKTTAQDWERLYRKARGELQDAEAKLAALGNVSQHLKSCEKACAEWQERAERRERELCAKSVECANVRLDLAAAVRVIRMMATDGHS